MSLKLYVGCYTRSLPHVSAQGRGIESLDFSPLTGRLSRLGEPTFVENPSWVTTNHDASRLYTVSELDKADGSCVTVWDTATNPMTHIARVAAHGDAPCHVQLDQTESHLLISNYGSGSLVVYGLDQDGKPAGDAQVHQHIGQGPNPDRQTGPHVHHALPSPDNARFAICDAGTDRVYVYDRAVLARADAVASCIATPAGSMPRHGVFSSDGAFFYCVHELGGIVSVFATDAGQFTLEQIISTLPVGVEIVAECAEIRLHPNGRFLYASNRGDNTIAGFSIDPSDGRLTPLGWWPTHGHCPRDFVIAPSGEHILIAHQDSNDITVCALDPATGALGQILDQIEIGSPVCLHVPAQS